MKVTIIGAAGGIGQPLALLTKLRTKVAELRLCDVVPLVKGVGADLSHIPTPAVITTFTGPEEMGRGIAGADIVLIPAGVPRKPGMTRDDLINVNAKIVKGIAAEVATHAPHAFVGVITNPVNTIVPLFVETLIRKGVPADQAARQVFGITTLDALRARTFLAAYAGWGDAASVHVPVVGGHAGTTILPLFSQARPYCPPMGDDVRAKLTKDTQDAGTVVVEAKAGAGSATLSMAQAAAEWLDVALAAKGGCPNAQIYAYVRTDVVEGCEYFAANCHVGTRGIVKVDGLGELAPSEAAAMADVRKQLDENVKMGKEIAAKE